MGLGRCRVNTGHLLSASGLRAVWSFCGSRVDRVVFFQRQSAGGLTRSGSQRPPPVSTLYCNSRFCPLYWKHCTCIAKPMNGKLTIVTFLQKIYLSNYYFRILVDPRATHPHSFLDYCSCLYLQSPCFVFISYYKDIHKYIY